jgi:hypothetical protein
MRSVIATTLRIGVVLSTKWTTTIQRRVPRIQIINPSPRSSPLCRVEAALKLEMARTT